MRVLALASASGGCAGAIVADGAVLAAFRLQLDRGLPEAIPPEVARIIAEAGMPELVAAVVGPGSFTGLRAGLSVAQGIAFGAGISAVGVTAAEAIASALNAGPGRSLWVANAARRGHVFLDRDGAIGSFAETALPLADGPVAVAGDAANGVAAVLAARGTNVFLTGLKYPQPLHVAQVGLQRHAGALPPLAAVPLYVDAAEAKLPAGGLRPAPVP